MSPFYPFTDIRSEHRALKPSANRPGSEIPSPVIILDDSRAVSVPEDTPAAISEARTHEMGNDLNGPDIVSPENIDDEEIFLDAREIQDEEWEGDTQCGDLPVQVYKTLSQNLSESKMSQELDLELSLLARPCFTFSSPALDGKTEVADSVCASNSSMYPHYSRPISGLSDRSVWSADTVFTNESLNSTGSFLLPEIVNGPNKKISWSEEETLGFSGVSDISLFRYSYPDERTREEKFEKGVPWGFHGRDYVPPELKQHSLRESMRDEKRGLSGFAMKLRNAFRRNKQGEKPL